MSGEQGPEGMETARVSIVRSLVNAEDPTEMDRIHLEYSDGLSLFECLGMLAWGITQAPDDYRSTGDEP